MKVVEARAEWLHIHPKVAAGWGRALINHMASVLHRDGQPMPVVVHGITCEVLAGGAVVEAARLLKWDAEDRMIEAAVYDGSQECLELILRWVGVESPVRMPEFSEADLDKIVVTEL